MGPTSQPTGETFNDTPAPDASPLPDPADAPPPSLMLDQDQIAQLGLDLPPSGKVTLKIVCDIKDKGGDDETGDGPKPVMLDIDSAEVVPDDENDEDEDEDDQESSNTRPKPRILGPSTLTDGE